MESKLIKFFIPFFFKFFFDEKIHAWDFKISPSFKTLKLLAFNVSPEEVISVINSADPVKGYASVAPRLSTNLNWVTPFENKNSLVKFGYLVATLSLFFFLSLNSNAISSRSAIVWTSIHGSGIATTKLAFPKLYFFTH